MVLLCGLRCGRNDITVLGAPRSLLLTLSSLNSRSGCGSSMHKSQTCRATLSRSKSTIIQPLAMGAVLVSRFAPLTNQSLQAARYRCFSIQAKPNAEDPQHTCKVGSAQFTKDEELVRLAGLVQELHHKLNEERERRRWSLVNTFCSSLVGAIALTAFMKYWSDLHGTMTEPRTSSAETIRHWNARSPSPEAHPLLMLVKSVEMMFILWADLESARWTISFLARSVAHCCRWIWAFATATSA